MLSLQKNEFFSLFSTPDFSFENSLTLRNFFWEKEELTH